MEKKIENRKQTRQTKRETEMKEIAKHRDNAKSKMC